MKIALIDDHPIIIEGYKAILISKNIATEEEVMLLSSISEAVDFIHQKSIFQEHIEVFVVDYNMPEDNHNHIKNGEELGLKIREYFPQTKIVLLTSIDTPLLLYNIINRLKPEGIWLKSDIGLLSFIQNITNVISGSIVYSESVKIGLKNVDPYIRSIDELNRKLLLLLHDGVKTKNLPNYLHLSLDTINHRKANLKSILGMNSGDDLEIINRAKSLGLL
jgi:DNA-binding NarL/FixJ family response regulator